MKKTLRNVAIVLVGVVLIAGYLWLNNPAHAYKRASPLVSSTLQDIQPKPIGVEDFEDGNILNALGGQGNCWGSENSTIDCAVEFEGNKGFLNMTYDVNLTDAFALYTSPLRKLNMTALETVWVAIKGEKGKEPIYIEFKDCGLSGPPQFPKELISDYLVQDITASEWSGVAIPLTEFEAITDWSCIEQVNILAHNRIGSGQGRIYVDDIRFLPNEVLVDDFQDIKPENELGGESGLWLKENTQADLTFSSTDGKLKIEYDVTPPDAEAAYTTSLRRTNLLLKKDALFFKIRGSQGSEEIAVEFRDCGLSGETHIPKIKVSDYLTDHISTDQREVAIPLATFADGIDWRCIETLNFLASSHPWFGSGQGTVFIDDITLAPTFHPIPLVVDHFNDCNDWNALLNTWSGHTNDADNIIETAPDATHRYGNNGCGFRIKYQVFGTTGAWAASELRGIDVTRYTHLRFHLKGAAGNEEMHVYLRDLNGKQRYYEEIRVTQNWQEIMIPLSYFSSAIDLAKVSELKIAFEWKSMNGEIYIDDISFVKPQLFLPITLKSYEEPCSDYVPSCPLAYNQDEPNNFRCSTNSALDPGTPTQSYICSKDDIDDYYYIDVTQLSPINVTLTNIPGGIDYDLYLYYQDSIVASSNKFGNASEALNYFPLQTGRYYIRVYPYSGHSLSPYTLQANFQ